LPRGATVLLASDDQALAAELEGQRVWRVGSAGTSSGAPGQASLDRAEIEALRAKGAMYLVLDAAASEALDPELRKQLDSRYSRLAGDQLVVYELAGRRTAPRRKRSHRVPGFSGLDVVCMPIIDWNYRFQRPQQLLTQLAKRGHRVFYIATTFQQDRRRPVISELADNVWGVRLVGQSDVNIYTDLASGEVVETALEGLDELRRDAGIAHAMTMVDLPFWAPIAIEARNRWGWKLIYDCMDEHGGFLTAEEQDSELRDLIDRQERSLLTSSDLVLATSKLLDEKVRSMAEKVVLVPNAADFEHFSEASTGPLPPSIPRPVIGYYGAISSWFDSEMVAHAARSRPDWSFVLAGRTTGADLTSFEGLSNIYLLGELTYETVPGLLHQFDVACIPFHLIDLTLATNPVKFYEYLSAGKPVVSVELPELQPYPGYFYPVSSNAEFVSQTERALSEDGPERRRARVELARENTWTDRYRTIESATRSWYQKTAVIICSFNNPDYLRMCLDSLREKTDYPNYEVIVVDNGSDQALLDEVAARSEHEQNLKLIANNENVGFARANNIGIEAAADADYIVLLNDDTIVTQGWLGRLIGHLQDKTVGMVGPVTSWAGNEAKIEVPYDDDLAGLDEFAARRAEEQRGEKFDIPVLAMYCMAIRKNLIDDLGRLDERFTIGMFEDDDFAMRVRAAGLRVVCAEDVFIHHWGRASFKRMTQEEYDKIFEEHKRVYEEIWARPWVPHRSRGS
jgi:GT2 family glycosyltransferase/glycosyltransferase involved in cell wall biosynthesis